MSANIRELFDLQGKVAVVTGGAGHLGKDMAEALAEAGARVYLCSRDQQHCQTVARDIATRTGATVDGLEIDITSSASVPTCFGRIRQQTGRIDVLVNNAVPAATYGRTGALEMISEGDWMSGIDGTVNGVFRCIQAVLPSMRAVGAGSIINIASMYGLVSPDPRIYGNTGQNSPPNYGAGKAAVVQLTRYAACHLASYGIRVNAVSPGAFPRTQVQENAEFLANLQNKIPLGRVGHPSELKGVVVFLASAASSYVTGANLPVDGGWTAW